MEEIHSHSHSHPHSTKHIIKEEISEHLKFTIISITISFIGILLLNKYQKSFLTQDLFKQIHYLHLLLASITPASLYYLYKKDTIRAVGVGILSSSIGCTISDSVFPYLGGNLLDFKMILHICLLSEPQFAWTAVFAGAFIGILLARTFSKVTHISHFAHTFVASVSALTYIITFGQSDSPYSVFFIIIILLFSVLIPCMLSDIVIPSLVFSESSFNDIMCHEHD